MSQIIVTSRYLKSGTETKRKNYTRYIATRETVEIREQNMIEREAPATEKQQGLLSDLLKDFPEAKKYLEYEDYKNNSTIENASELISSIIERNADVIGNRQNFVGYMAMRPGVEKRGSHGLFNDKDEPIILNQAANEIANHPGNVWSHVVSLRREDAIRLGYDNSDRWRDLVKRHISDISEAQRIPLCNLKWYAAFHDTTHHPHIHLLVYSTNAKQGFLTKHGIDKIRSVFANDIFYDDLQSIYQKQTIRRDELKAESKKYVENLLKEITEGDFENAELEKLIKVLHMQLKNCKGKKVYGYLPPEVKKTVNAIFKEISKDKSIQSLYEKWCELERQKYKTYTQKEKEFPPLYENKVFHSVRNSIIGQVLNMDSLTGFFDYIQPEPIEITTDEDIPPPIDDIVGDFNWSDNTIEFNTVDFESDSHYYIKWSTTYKEACKIIYNKKSEKKDYEKAEQLLIAEADSGNVLAVHDLGKLYSTEKLCENDEAKSYKYYEEALQGFTEIEPNADFMFPYEADYQKPVDMRSYVWYRIGKMHCYGLGTQQDYEKAFEWFLKSAKEGNKFAQYSLGNLYYYGNGTDKDLSQAFLWYQKSSSQGQPYASYSIAQMYNKGEYVSQSEENAQRYYKNALSGFLELESKNQADDNLYYKLGSMFKKGLGTDIDMDKAIEYFKRSAEMNNINAKRTLALEYISGKHLELDIEKGLEILTECADSGDTLSCYKLGKMYFKGEIVYKDLNMAEKYFLKASEKENQYAYYLLGKLYLEKEKYSLDKAVEYFEKAVQYDEIKPYAAYSLAKIMLDNNPYHDSEKAVSILESAAMENDWASFLLGRLYLYGTDDIPKDNEKAEEWLTMSASQGNEYAQYMLDNIQSFENAVVANTIFGLFVNLSRCIADDYNRKYKSNRMSADRKLRRIIQQKKQALGLKEEHLQNQELY
ncbi:MobP3 family relaxase [Porcipelethomonas sp.]|uniref:MobP3 family relaxase n=1 Tax=Porcipelethomonas sp. TaxID=2981675 RepID=UPI00307799B2